ncbi:VOC family protein [Staphylococcus arlettae]|uniref:VOC family protein n=1 Tax=Staphylococcus arlettae TaxID=29378 RepID=UPI0021D3885E|nr:VOC family protein [Staphylococcus arlettae]UXU52638.1 hypothetical protein MUA71_00770 [Staphylococcus arlettae]
MRATNIKLLTHDFRTMFQFYKEQLALECMYGHEESNYADFKLEEIYLSLFDKALMMEALNYEEAMTDKHIQQIIVVEVTDLNKTYESLCNKVTVITEPTPREAWGIKCFHILDPDNNIIEFYNAL